MKLFIVDDEVWMRRGIKSILDSSGLDMEIAGEAEDGLEALEAIESVKPDILLVDIRMPGMDGLTFISEAMKRLEQSKYIIISGYDDFDYAKRAISLQVVDYVLKPIDKENLVNSIRKAIELLENERSKKNTVVKAEWLINETLLQIKEKMVIDLINQSNGSAKNDMRKLFGIDLEAYGFTCISVKVLGLEQVMKERGEKEASLIRFTLKNLTHELVTNQYQGIDFFNNNGILNILLMDYKSKPIKIQQVKHELQQAIREAVDHLGFFTVRTASGGVHEGAEGIKLSYREAIHALKSAVISETCHCEEKNGKKPVISNETCYPVQKEKQLLECILVGNTEGIRETVKDMLALSSENKKPVPALEKVMDFMWLIGDKMIVEKAIPVNNIRTIGDHEKDLIYYDSMEHIADTLGEYFSSISAALRKANQTSGKQAIEEVKEYIRTHFNEDISLAQLSKITHMNPNYLSELFKDNTGMNFIDYLTKVRMEKACEYLVEYDMPINRIAALVGYENERYFSTVFKKLLSSTPREYRSKHR